LGEDVELAGAKVALANYLRLVCIRLITLARISEFF